MKDQLIISSHNGMRNVKIREMTHTYLIYNLLKGLRIQDINLNTLEGLNNKLIWKNRLKM